MGKTKRTRLLIFLIIIIMSSLVSLVAANTVFMVKNEIYNGVVVGGIDVGGLSISAAEEKITETYKNRTLTAPIVLSSKDRQWTIALEDIDLRIDAPTLAQTAYDVGRTGNIFYRLKERYITVNYGKTLPLQLSFNEEKLVKKIEEITNSVNTEAINAQLLYDGETISILPESIGRKLDPNKTLADIILQINSGIPLKFDLQIENIYPDISTNDLKNIDSVLAIYTTEFNQHNANRVQNINLAAKSIDNILVRSGEVFSFNTTVGPRLAKFGYKEAPVLIDGKLVPDFGGGVCQVSSTLYNAVLLSDMFIVERTSHFRPPSYVPIGQDATVADNLLDFKFKNSSLSSIYIRTQLSNNQVSVYVFGHRSPKPATIQIVATNKVVIEPNVIIKQDPTLELGKEIVESEGQKGFHVTLYRIKSVDNQEIGRELLSTDEFKPEDRIIRVGTKVMMKQSGVK